MLTIMAQGPAVQSQSSTVNSSLCVVALLAIFPGYIPRIRISHGSDRHSTYLFDAPNAFLAVRGLGVVGVLGYPVWSWGVALCLSVCLSPEVASRHVGQIGRCLGRDSSPGFPRGSTAG